MIKYIPHIPFFHTSAIATNYQVISQHFHKDEYIIAKLLGISLCVSCIVSKGNELYTSKKLPVQVQIVLLQRSPLSSCVSFSELYSVLVLC